ncbi:COG1361 S-layer family protein [Methanoplanus limicola]|uniref:S-layer-like domain-containing protein n=1 Tax=Methanoplanus limicola DSM 2279 TaxID=937775 RepID=H1YYX4_9EURY|nr:CARDB domain-containing protein [Methanoplanus limicola]EHQ37046.1 S-layer-like domain-containing protein [Methanoplanus limicola DSM 2279]
MKLKYLLFACLIVAACVIMPASAGSKYLSGEPEISLAISGTNEYSPGDDVTLTVSVQNSGMKNVKIIQSDIVDRDDNPDTAKMVNVGIDSGKAPVTIKSGSQMIGDIAGGATKSVSFKMEVDRYAEDGEYNLIGVVKYKYLYFAEQSGTDAITYYWKDVTEEIPLKITIKPKIVIDVSDVRTDSMNVGTEGYITMNVKNTGYESGKNSVIKLSRAGTSAVIPTDSSVFVGDFAPGDVKSVTFKASVSENAEAKNYPVLVSVDYKDSDGKEQTSDSETVGVDVGGKIDFEIVSPTTVLQVGEKGTIEIEYKNTGAATAYNAKARISAVDPFTSNDDTAYLGDLAPGETATGRYEVTVDSTATVKNYGIDSEIRYRDSLDNSQISDSMKAEIEITKKSGMSVLTSPIVITLILFVLIGAGYFVFKRRKN